MTETWRAVRDRKNFIGPRAEMNDGSDGYRTHSSRASRQKGVCIAVVQADRKVEESLRI